VLAELPKARWAHLATHGFFADATFRSALHVEEKLYERSRFSLEWVEPGARNPLVLSGLVLAGANLPTPQGEDPLADEGGILTAEAIASLPLFGLDLAVLSACETGLGEVGGAEGVFGLQRAFHQAGARTVVASLWKVDDQATRVLMETFYRNLWQKKLSKLEALRQAQLALLKGYDPRQGQLRGPGTERPVSPQQVTGTQRGNVVPALLWAGWVLSGDPGDLSPVEAPPSETAGPKYEPGSSNWLVAIGSALIGLALVLLVRQRYRRTNRGRLASGPYRERIISP
jgi:CHAT domain-containing protein